MLNLENKKRMQSKKIGRNRLTHIVSDIYYYVYCLYVKHGPQPPLFYGEKLF